MCMRLLAAVLFLFILIKADDIRLKITDSYARELRDRDSHFTNIQILHDTIFALCEGLTVPFALAAGLSGAECDGRVVVKAGIAEVLWVFLIPPSPQHVNMLCFKNLLSSS